MTGRERGLAAVREEALDWCAVHALESPPKAIDLARATSLTIGEAEELLDLLEDEGYIGEPCELTRLRPWSQLAVLELKDRADAIRLAAFPTEDNPHDREAAGPDRR